MPDGNDDVELDLLERYQWMVDTQIDTLDGIDDKAATVLRIEAILLGVLITGFSIVVAPRAPNLESGFGFSWLIIGFASLVLSMGYAILSYLSSRFLYGPTRDLGFELAKHSIPENDYRNFLLAGYSEALRRNETAVRRNSRRFRNTLELLLVGIVALFVSAALFTLDLSPGSEVVLTGFVSLAIVLVVRYVHREDYLTIPHGDSDDD